MLIVSLLVAALLVGCTYTLPYRSTTHVVEGGVVNKVGESSEGYVFGIPTKKKAGDSTIKTAAKNGGISKIATAEKRLTIYFPGIYHKITTIVTGE